VEQVPEFTPKLVATALTPEQFEALRAQPASAGAAVAGESV
jgi:hypothetical protein